MEGGLIELPNMLALIIKFKEIKQTSVLITLTFPDFKGFDCTFLNKEPKNDKSIKNMWMFTIAILFNGNTT